MNSITPKPLNDFVAIDVEYANREQDICQIGLVVVRNLEIVEQRVWVIQPFDNHYDENFSRAHHMTEADTAYAPTFDIVWLNEIRSYFLIGQLWAHNAISVEQPVLEKNFRENGLREDWLKIYDSRDLYQRPDCLPNSGNGLPQCCMALGIPFDAKQHHDAGYDALKCAEIVIAYAKGQEPDWTGVPKNTEELRKQLQEKRVLRLGDFQTYYTSTSSGEEDVIAVLSSTDGSGIEQVIDVFDKGDVIKEVNTASLDFSRIDKRPNNPLCGKRVVLTGLFKIKRDDIKNALDVMGAKRTSSISGKTDIIILGMHNVGYTKVIDLEQQEAKGHHIFRIVGDTDLEALLYGDGDKFFMHQC